MFSFRSAPGNAFGSLTAPSSATNAPASEAKPTDAKQIEETPVATFFAEHVIPAYEGLSKTDKRIILTRIAGYSILDFLALSNSLQLSTRENAQILSHPDVQRKNGAFFKELGAHAERVAKHATETDEKRNLDALQRPKKHQQPAGDFYAPSSKAVTNQLAHRIDDFYAKYIAQRRVVSPAEQDKSTFNDKLIHHLIKKYACEFGLYGDRVPLELQGGLNVFNDIYREHGIKHLKAEILKSLSQRGINPDTVSFVQDEAGRFTVQVDGRELKGDERELKGDESAEVIEVAKQAIRDQLQRWSRGPWRQSVGDISNIKHASLGPIVAGKPVVLFTLQCGRKMLVHDGLCGYPKIDIAHITDVDGTLFYAAKWSDDGPWGVFMVTFDYHTNRREHDNWNWASRFKNISLIGEYNQKLFYIAQEEQSPERWFVYWHDKDELGIHGIHDYDVAGFLARIGAKQQTSPAAQPITRSESELLAKLTLVASPTAADVAAYVAASKDEQRRKSLSPEDEASEFFSNNRAVIENLNGLIGDSPDLFAHLFRAKTTKPLPAHFDAVVRVIAPLALRAFKGAGDAPPPLDKGTLAGSSQETTGVIGSGDPRSRQEEILLRSNLTGPAFLCADLYAGWNSSRWQKFHAPAGRHARVSDESDSTRFTVTIPFNHQAAEIAIPKTLWSHYIPDSVNVQTGDAVMPHPVTLSCDGTAYVNTSSVPLNSAITYSLQVPRSDTQSPAPLSDKEYRAFLSQHAEVRDQLLTPLGTLNETCRSFLLEIASLSPLERVEQIMSFVSLYGHFDYDNAEVWADKFNKSPEQIMAVMESRALQLKAAGKAASTTEYAGVCFDMALLYTAMLRESGIAAGIALGWLVNDAGNATTRQHAKVFIPWVSDDPTDKGVRYLERTPIPSNSPAAQQASEASAPVARNSLRLKQLEKSTPDDTEAGRGLKHEASSNKTPIPGQTADTGDAPTDTLLMQDELQKSTPTDAEAGRQMERQDDPEQEPQPQRTADANDAPAAQAEVPLTREKLLEMLEKMAAEPEGEQSSGNVTSEQLEAAVANFNNRMSLDNVVNVAALLDVVFYAPPIETPTELAAAVRYVAQEPRVEQYSDLLGLLSEFIDRGCHRQTSSGAEALSSEPRQNTITAMKNALERGQLALSALEFDASITTLCYLSLDTHGSGRKA